MGMTDLRTGLVEAMARASEQVGTGLPINDETWEWAKTHRPTAYAEMIQEAEAALDAALGFLTDNAEGWAEADRLVHTRPGYDPRQANHHTTEDTALHLLQVLLDSGATGETT